MRLIAAIGTGALALFAISSAQAATALQADVQVTQLSYSLRDLRPSDGISPLLGVSGSYDSYSPGNIAESIYFVTGNSSYGTLVDQSTASNRLGKLFGNENLQSNLEGDLASASWTGRNARATLNVDGQELSKQDYRMEEDSWSWPVFAGAPIVSAYVSAPRQYLLLSSHSEVAFSGQYTVSASVDASELIGHTNGLGLRASASAGAHFQVLPPTWGDVDLFEITQQDTGADVETYQDIGPDGLLPGGLTFDQKSSSFNTIVRNNSDQDMYFEVFFGLGVSGNVSLTPLPVVTPPITFPPQVPEPSSWALMLMGLGAIGVARRRRA